MNDENNISERSANSYCADNDKPITFPISKAIELSEQIITTKSKDEILSHLTRAKAHAKLKSDDDHRMFEASQTRITFLALNFAANKHGILAPAFRGRLIEGVRRKDQGQKSLPSYIQAMYSLDRQLIDVHWFYCRVVEKGFQDSMEINGEYLWEDGTINSAAVEKFVQNKWQAKKKVEALQITPSEQLELSTIRTAEISDRHYDVLRNKDTDMIKIKEFCTKSTQLDITQAADLYEDLRALRLAGKNVTLATRLRQLVETETSDTRSLDTRKRQMQRRKELFQKKLLLLK